MGNINMRERVATGRALGILVILAQFRHFRFSQFGSLEIVIWDLFEIWYLGFGILK